MIIYSNTISKMRYNKLIFFYNFRTRKGDQIILTFSVVCLKMVLQCNPMGPMEALRITWVQWKHYELHGSNGSTTSTSPSLGECLLVNIRSFSASSEVRLDLAVLGQVESSDLLSLLDLLLVGLDLALELVNQTLHSLVVLPVLILLVSQFLDVSFRLSQVLLSIIAPSVFNIKLRLKFADTSLHLGDGLLSTLESVLLSLINPVGSVLNLCFQELLVPLQSHGHFLFSTKFIRESGSIDHGTLGFLFRHSSLTDHLIKIMSHGGHLLLTLHLGSSNCLVLTGLRTEVLISICQLRLHKTSVPVCLIQQCTRLLQGILVRITSPVSSQKIVCGHSLGSNFVLKPLLDIADVVLDQTNVPLTLGIGSISMFERNSKIDDIIIKLLLQS